MTGLYGATTALLVESVFICLSDQKRNKTAYTRSRALFRFSARRLMSRILTRKVTELTYKEYMTNKGTYYVIETKIMDL